MDRLGVARLSLLANLVRLFNLVRLKSFLDQKSLVGGLVRARKDSGVFSQTQKLNGKRKVPSRFFNVIIIDEIVTLCSSRSDEASSYGSITHNSLVNQLLAKMDGVDTPGNFLVIGMTNRRDSIDKALLRPGRFEVQVEIKSPNTDHRLEILNIHTKKMRNSGIMGDDVAAKLGDIAQVTDGYSGADLEGLVKAASSLAIMRRMYSSSSKNNMSQQLSDTSKLKVEFSDLEHAMNDMESDRFAL